MGNYQNQEENLNNKRNEVEIEKIDENNPPNPPQFYPNKDIFNNTKISDLISHFCTFNIEEMKPYEKSKIGNMNILKNEENQDLSDLGYTKKDFEEEKIKEKENIIIKLDSNTEKINQSQNNTSTSPFLSTNNINLKDDYTINDNIKIKKENNNKETNINKKENEESSKMKTININEEKNEKETNRTINKEEEKEKEKEELQNNIITNKTEKKSSKRLISAKRLDSVLLEKPIETTAGSLLQDIRKIYKFKEVLGGGHFGTVRVAYKRKEEPRRYYAIKSISKKNLSPSDLEDLIKEVDIISGLDHPVIIDFYETYQDEFFFHIVMELCKGKEVFQKIASEGKIEEKKVAIVINKVLNAIAYCHSRGITHRDIKPENIIFETNEQNSEIKLIDFGLSRKYSVDQKMHTILGTPYYIAPEVLKGNYDEKCDIWSIGALTYIMLSGEPPFKGKSNNEIFMKIIKDPIKFNPYKWNNLSENSKNFIKLCLNKDPQKRPNAVEALGHVWFNSIEISSPKNITQDILNNIKNFSIKQQFKKIVLRYILSTLNETELKKYKRAFYAIDFKHNGTISKEELKRAFEIGKIEITDDNINKVFKLCDENQKGSLDYTDFLMCAYDKKYLLTDQKLNLAFQYFDVDNSGIIEIHDVKDAMLRFGKNVVDSDDTKKLIMEITKDENVDSIILEQFVQMFNK